MAGNGKSKQQCQRIIRLCVQQGASWRPTASGFIIRTELGSAGAHWSQFAGGQVDRRGALNFRTQLKRIGLDIDPKLFRS